MPNIWDGKTERRRDPSDHDNLIRMLVITENLVKNFDTHVVEDKRNFGFLNKAVWIGFGALGMLEILMRITGR